MMEVVHDKSNQINVTLYYYILIQIKVLCLLLPFNCLIIVQPTTFIKDSHTNKFENQNVRLWKSVSAIVTIFRRKETHQMRYFGG